MSAKRSKAVISLIGVLLLLVSVLFLEKSNNFTGSAVSDNSQAGNVNEANISRSSSSWHGFFGEITVNASASIPSAIAQGGEMTEFDLELPCTEGEVYLSILNDLDFSSITGGSAESVDIYLNLNSSNPQSGTQVFKNLSSFTVNETLITDAPTTYTAVKNSPGNTTFNLGVLNHSSNLVFVSSISFDTVGFDGSTHDYQIMVPVNESGVTYYFFSDCSAAEEEAPAVPLPAVGAGVGGAARIVGYCGDGICLVGENCSSCSFDCGQCPAPHAELPAEEPEIENITEISEEAIEEKKVSLDLEQAATRIAERLEETLAGLEELKFLLFVAIALLLAITFILLKVRSKLQR